MCFRQLTDCDFLLGPSGYGGSGGGYSGGGYGGSGAGYGGSGGGYGGSSGYGAQGQGGYGGGKLPSLRVESVR